MIDIHYIYLYGVAAIIVVVALWLGDRSDRKYQERRNKEIRDGAFEAWKREAQRYKELHDNNQ